jgi:NitT/TauT family transport system substrate-binding protein
MTAFEEEHMPLKIMPHGRLQEWVAEEKGFFTAEGLDYTFLLNSGDYGIHSVQRDEGGEVRTGAFETFEAGRDGADVSCACHWATNAAAGERSGHLVTTAYSVAPCAIVVPPESPVRRPEDLAGVPIAVGYHSGSHFATVQALEGVLGPDEAKLTFQGPPNERLDALLQRGVQAATAWGVPLYIAEAFGFRKVVDATFMIGFLVTGSEASKADIDKYLAALRRAQMEIDLRPELYKHYHLRSVPEKYRDQVDVRAFGTGERIVFLEYTRENFEATRQWTEAHDLFSGPPSAGYDQAALVLYRTGRAGRLLDADTRPVLGALADLPHHAGGGHVEHVHGQGLLVGQHERAGVHDAHPGRQRLVVGQPGEPDRVRVEVRVGVVDPVHAALGHQQRVGVQFERSLHSRVVGGDVGLADAAGQQHDHAALQVMHGAEPDEGLGHAVDRHRGHHPHVGFGPGRERAPEHQRVHDRAEHADVVRLGPADAPALGHPAAEVVAAADDHRHLHAEIVYGENLLGHPGQAGRVDPGASRSGECLATELDDDPAIARHSALHPAGNPQSWLPGVATPPTVPYAGTPSRALLST